MIIILIRAHFRLHEQSVHEGTATEYPTMFLCTVTSCALSKVEWRFLQSLSAPSPNETRDLQLERLGLSQHTLARIYGFKISGCVHKSKG